MAMLKGPLLAATLALCAASSVAAADIVPVPALTARFAWLSGGWCARDEDEFVEEYWLPARGPLMLGVRRAFKNGLVDSFEFMRIEEIDGKLVYKSQPQGGAEVVYEDFGNDTWSANFMTRGAPPHLMAQYSRQGLVLEVRLTRGARANKDHATIYEFRPCRPINQDNPAR
jgi:hypothetical protein